MQAYFTPLLAERQLSNACVYFPGGIEVKLSAWIAELSELLTAKIQARRCAALRIAARSYGC